MKRRTENYLKNAYIAITLLIVLLIGSLAWILWSNFADSTGDSDIITADIFQNGALIDSICLSTVDTPYTFTITGDNGCQNEIEVRHNSIGIIAADCPDKLCVHQGFVHSSQIPITCLPNHLVIRLRSQDNEDASMDAVTY